MKIMVMQFKPEDADLFRVFIDGLLNTTQGFAGIDSRVYGKMLDKVEALGVPAETPQGTILVLKPEGGEIEFTNLELRLAHKAIDAVPYVPRFIRAANRLKDMLRVESSDDDKPANS